jgi:hypothetical protein
VLRTRWSQIRSHSVLLSRLELPYYLRRLYIAPGLLLEEGLFLGVALILAIGSVESVKGAVGPLGRRSVYLAVVALLLGWQYRERVSRIRAERRAAESAIPSVIEAAARMPPFSGDFSVRANVMLLRTPDRLRVVYRTSNIRQAADAELELGMHQGIAGPVLLYGKTRATSDPNPKTYMLEDDQYSATRDLRTVVSVPIQDPNEPNLCMGVLNIDSRQEYNVRSPGFTGAVDAIEEMAQALGPLLELAGSVWYKKKTQGQLFPIGGAN